MTDHAIKTKSADDPAFQLPASLAGLSFPLAVGGVVLLVAGVLLGIAAGPSTRFTMSAYLTAFVYCLTISLGCLFFVLIQHLCRAGWSVVVRRVAEMMMIAIPALGIMFLPILFTIWMGDGTVYKWDDPNFAAEKGVFEEVWTEKTRFLNAEWFTVRAIIYIAVWSALAIYYFRLSRRQDETGEVTLTERMQARSGPAVMLFALSLSFAAFDWLMSLAPMWFSTMFGVYVFAGSVLAAHCAIAVVTYLLQSRGALRDEVTIEHYHDLGKLINGFTLFWVYIAFSQFMLIWYGNIPEETEWIYDRQLGVWGVLGVVLVVLHWMVPFLGLMSRHIRRNPKLVFAWALYLLVMHFIDIYWIIMPEAASAMGGVMGVITSLLLTAGMIGLYAGGVLWYTRANNVKVLAVRDPRLPESLAFENI
ncbi:MAG: hypothetical protein ACO1RT_12690 [Planctomycetaceae bacterium]